MGALKVGGFRGRPLAPQRAPSLLPGELVLAVLGRLHWHLLLRDLHNHLFLWGLNCHLFPLPTNSSGVCSCGPGHLGDGMGWRGGPGVRMGRRGGPGLWGSGGPVGVMGQGGVESASTQGVMARQGWCLGSGLPRPVSPSMSSSVEAWSLWRVKKTLELV